MDIKFNSGSIIKVFDKRFSSGFHYAKKRQTYFFNPLHWRTTYRALMYWRELLEQKSLKKGSKTGHVSKEKWDDYTKISSIKSSITGSTWKKNYKTITKTIFTLIKHTIAQYFYSG